MQLIPPLVHIFCQAVRFETQVCSVQMGYFRRLKFGLSLGHLHDRGTMQRSYIIPRPSRPKIDMEASIQNLLLPFFPSCPYFLSRISTVKIIADGELLMCSESMMSPTSPRAVYVIAMMLMLEAYCRSFDVLISWRLVRLAAMSVMHSMCCGRYV